MSWQERLALVEQEKKARDKARRPVAEEEKRRITQLCQERWDEFRAQVGQMLADVHAKLKIGRIKEKDGAVHFVVRSRAPTDALVFIPPEPIWATITGDSVPDYLWGRPVSEIARVRVNFLRGGQPSWTSYALPMSDDLLFGVVERFVKDCLRLTEA